MSQAVATIESAGVQVDHQAILKTLNLNPRDPNTQALLLVCERYQLDPLLKHMVLIQGSPYITRDGYLAIAHRSGVFDGMEVLEQSSDQSHFTAKVAVYRKDMGRPFTFIGRYPKSSRMAKDYGPEMAVKVAEVQALRRAFNVTGVGAADERWDAEASPSPVVDERPVVELPKSPLPPPEVDAETGEVRTRRRKPPAPPAPAEAVSGRPVEQRKPPAEKVAELTRLIEVLQAAGGAWADIGRARWKAAGVPVRPATQLMEADVDTAIGVLSQVAAEISEGSAA